MPLLTAPPKPSRKVLKDRMKAFLDLDEDTIWRREAPTYEPPEDSASFQFLIPEEDQVSTVFEAFMEELGLSKKQRQLLGRLPPHARWKFVRQNAQRQQIDGLIDEANAAAEDDNSPEAYVKQLQANPTFELVTAIRVSLTSQPASWVSGFVELHGLAELLNVLKAIEAKSRKTIRDEQTQEECIRCLRALMNNSQGLMAVLNTDNSIDTIALSLDTSSTATRTNALELLSAVCMLPPNGHHLTLDAMTNYKNVKHPKLRRFYRIVDALKTDTNLAFRTASMVFINALVNSPDDIDFRIHLRSEFFRLGLDDIIQEMKSDVQNRDLNLAMQIQLYEEEGAYDNEDMGGRFNVDDIDINDPEQVALTLLQASANSDCYFSVLSTLQHFLSLPNDPDLQLKYWMVIERLISQIVLQRSDGDLDDTFFAHLNMKELIFAQEDRVRLDTATREAAEAAEKLAGQERAHKEALEALEHRIASLSEMVEARDQTIDGFDAKHKAVVDELAAVRQAKADIEAELAAVREQITAKDAQIASLEEIANAKQEQVAQFSESRVKILEEQVAALSAGPAITKEMIEAYSKRGKVASLETQMAALEPALRADFQTHITALEAEIGMLREKVAELEANGGGGGGGGGSAGGAGGAGAAAAPPPPAANPPPPPPPPNTAPPPPPPPPGGGPPPPPPPPGPGGGPPPPPPPPGGGPPPPPGMGMMPAKKRKKHAIPKSNVKLKGVNVTKIPKRLVNKTMWADVDETELFSELDFGAIDAVFGKVEKAPAAADPSKKKKKEKPKVVSLLDGRRAQSISILVARFKLSFAEVRQAIIALDEVALTEQQVKSIITVCPTDEEVATLNGYTEDPARLGSAERFLMQMIKIPRLEPRLAAFSLRYGFDELMADVQPRIETVTAAVEEIRDSESFKKLLTLILAFANYMNNGTFRKNMAGVRWKDLAGLKDVRGQGGKTLLHMLVETVDAKFEDLREWYVDLEHASGAAGISVETVSADLRSLRNRVDNLASELHDHTEDYSAPGDRFVEKMTPFYEDVAARVDTAEGMLKTLDSLFPEVALVFGEEKTTNEEFFGTVVDFAEAFKQARKDNEKAAAAAAKKAAREAAAAAKGGGGGGRARRGSIAPGVTGSVADAGGKGGRKMPAGGPGAIDDLISSLKSGDALLRRRGTRRKSQSIVAAEAQAMFANLKKNRRRGSRGGSGGASGGGAGGGDSGAGVGAGAGAGV